MTRLPLVIQKCTMKTNVSIIAFDIRNTKLVTKVHFDGKLK